MELKSHGAEDSLVRSAMNGISFLSTHFGFTHSQLTNLFIVHMYHLLI